MDLRQHSPKIFDLAPSSFDAAALEIFHYQYTNNPLYRDYVDALKVRPRDVTVPGRIPFLPIRFFKTHLVKTGDFLPALTFESSGTTTTVNSRHLVKDAEWYRQSFTRCFELFYGPARDYCVIGLLPSYLERGQSSLVYMVNSLIEQSGHPDSGFYLESGDQLEKLLRQLEDSQQKTLLIGVTFALLDFAERSTIPLDHTIIMETGGMKGRRKEMIRQELHERLRQSFGSASIHSEYGMTELLSQAYSRGEGRFHCPPWMKIMLRDDADPLSVWGAGKKNGGAGVINVIDLANIHSCAFIATDDAGRLYSDGSFEVLGRVDNSDLRGCSLLTV